MAVKWIDRINCGGASGQRTDGKLFPVLRHQFIPTAIQSAADSGNGGNEQIYFTGLDSPHTPRVYIGKLSQSLLSHPQGRANTADVAAEFAEIGGGFNFGHALLRERFEIDLKGVIRPNRVRQIGKG
jgi:hypothetical protein